MARSRFNTRTISLIFALAAAIYSFGPTLRGYFRKPIVPHQVEVFFSPKGGCTDAVVDSLQNAKKSVLVQAYSFTSPEIAKALVDAQRRGLEVKIILDKSQKTERYSQADFTAHSGVPTWIDSNHSIAHNKIMVIDGVTVITGSFNFTRNAEKNNAENLVLIHDAPDLAKLYTENWQQHLHHSIPYQAR